MMCHSKSFYCIRTNIMFHICDITQRAETSPNAQNVPFFLAGPREQSLIRSALKTFQFMSCLRFVEWDGRSEDYLYIHFSKERPG